MGGRAGGKEDNEKGDQGEKEASEVVPQMCHMGEEGGRS